MNKLWIKSFALSIMIMGMFVLTSCDSDQSNKSSTSNNEITTKGEGVGDVDDSNNYFERRKIAEENIDIQISAFTDEIERLKKQTTKDVNDRSQIDQRIIVLEERKGFLQDQKNRLESKNNDQTVLESVEANLQKVLEEEVEMQEKDRTGDVRGEGTSLDGPALNKSGTRTGTEVERRQESIVESVDPLDTTDEDQR